MASPERAESRHLPLLDILDGGRNVSQRTLAGRLGTGASRVNRLLKDLKDLLDRGYVEVVDLVEARIRRRLRRLKDEGVRRLVFYGAGEVMDVVHPLAREAGFEVLGAVDDDPEKQGEGRGGLSVGPPDSIRSWKPCAVVITTFNHADEIRARLKLGTRSTMRVVDL